MKRFKIIFISISVIYICIWIFGNYILTTEEKEQDALYMIEINRLYTEYVLYLNGDEDTIINKGNNSISENKIIFIESDNSYNNITEYQVKNGDYVHYVMYMEGSSDDGKEEEVFYGIRNGYDYVIKPVMEGENIKGYIRFDYKAVVTHEKIIVLYNIAVIIMGLMCAGIVIYVYRHIIRPFNELSNIPYELAKGNLNHNVKEEKGKYFGRFIWGIGMLKDTLEHHKKRELELARDKKMILLAISHDIKTPLNTIDLYAKALGRNMYKSNEERVKATEKISEKVAEIDDFVKDIVKSSSEDIVVIEVDNTEFYAGELIDKIKKGYEEKCIIRHIRFTIGEYDNIILYGDMDRLYEVAGNLMENAFKYGDGVEIRIDFGIEENYFLISIYNTGNPVESNEMSHLFDSFFRGKNAENKQGNGLGLYICQEIMRNMEGEIYATQEKEGMKFTIVVKISE